MDGNNSISKVVRKVSMHDIDEEGEDILYWLSKTPEERIAAVTFLVHQSLEPGATMDRSHVVTRRMTKDDD